MSFLIQCILTVVYENQSADIDAFCSNQLTAFSNSVQFSYKFIQPVATTSRANHRHFVAMTRHYR